MGIGGFFRSVGSFLFSRANKEFLLFLSFLALAGVFWLMMTLNETYEQEVRIAVRFVNVPKSTVLTSGDTDTIRVSISDKGFNILTYLYGKPHTPLDIDFSRCTINNGSGSVSAADLKKMMDTELPASSKIIGIKPDRLVFYYNNGESKRVPVRWQGHVQPQHLYYISQTTITPDSVTVYASRRMLDSIQAVYTEPLNYADFHDTLHVQTRLATTVGVKIVPDVVNISFVTDVLTDVRIDGIPVEGINMPEGKVLRTFPAKVSVRFVTGMKNYQQLSAADFQVVADYDEFSQDASSKCNITIRRMPDGLSHVRLETQQVDYLIEQHTP